MMRKERAYDPPSSYFEGQKSIIEMVKSNAVMPKKKPSSSSDLVGFGNLQAMNLLTTKQANTNELASESKWKLGNTNFSFGNMFAFGFLFLFSLELCVI